MNSSDTRVSAYLDDLARMLGDLDPATRDDVLAGVREHLDATLAEHPDDPAAVDAALLRLGPPEQVAAAARADLPPPATDPYARPGATPATRHPRRARVAALASLVIVAVPTAVALVGRVGAEVLNSIGTDDTGGLFLGPHPSEALFVLPPLLPLWILALVVALLGPDLEARTKAGLVSVGPAMTASVLTATLLSDPRSFATPIVLVVLGATAAAIVVTARKVWRDTRP
ncbi:HAAS signaling domain-containing protein [Oryzobacter telluris]|uniref:HAAS signaling domain-containing protein n=1 Tax=Oryzobacter telluris TaxID=3149179 RepID=UPI00370D1633